MMHQSNLIRADPVRVKVSEWVSRWVSEWVSALFYCPLTFNCANIFNNKISSFRWIPLSKALFIIIISLFWLTTASTCFTNKLSSHVSDRTSDSINWLAAERTQTVSLKWIDFAFRRVSSTNSILSNSLSLASNGRNIDVTYVSE